MCRLDKLYLMQADFSFDLLCDRFMRMDVNSTVI